MSKKATFCCSFDHFVCMECKCVKKVIILGVVNSWNRNEWHNSVVFLMGFWLKDVRSTCCDMAVDQFSGISWDPICCWQLVLQFSAINNWCNMMSWALGLHSFFIPIEVNHKEFSLKRSKNGQKWKTRYFQKYSWISQNSQKRFLRRFLNV